MPSLNARVYLFQGQDRVSRLSRVAFVDERYLILIAYALPGLASDATSIFEEHSKIIMGEARLRECRCRRAAALYHGL